MEISEDWMNAQHLVKAEIDTLREEQRDQDRKGEHGGKLEKGRKRKRRRNLEEVGNKGVEETENMEDNETLTRSSM